MFGNLLEIVHRHGAYIKDRPEEYQPEAWTDLGERLRGFCNNAAGVGCPECFGTGNKTYGSTATWRGGMGGASMTKGICDVCWGTGRTDVTGADQRKMRDILYNRDLLASAQWFSRRIGTAFNLHRQHFITVADKISRARWGADFNLNRVADAVADALRELAEVKEEENV